MKIFQTLFVSTFVTTASLISLPSMAKIQDTQVNALVNALKEAAPPNRANDGMYSAWQVLPNIIPSWTKQCVGQAMTGNYQGCDRDPSKTYVQRVVDFYQN